MDEHRLEIVWSQIIASAGSPSATKDFSEISSLPECLPSQNLRDSSICGLPPPHTNSSVKVDSTADICQLKADKSHPNVGKMQDPSLVSPIGIDGNLAIDSSSSTSLVTTLSATLPSSEKSKTPLAETKINGSTTASAASSGLPLSEPVCNKHIPSALSADSIDIKSSVEFSDSTLFSKVQVPSLQDKCNGVSPLMRRFFPSQMDWLHFNLQIAEHQEKSDTKQKSKVFPKIWSTESKTCNEKKGNNLIACLNPTKINNFCISSPSGHPRSLQSSMKQTAQLTCNRFVIVLKGLPARVQMFMQEQYKRLSLLKKSISNSSQWNSSFQMQYFFLNYFLRLTHVMKVWQEKRKNCLSVLDYRKYIGLIKKTMYFLLFVCFSALFMVRRSIPQWFSGKQALLSDKIAKFRNIPSEIIFSETLEKIKKGEIKRADFLGNSQVLLRDDSNTVFSSFIIPGMEHSFFKWVLQQVPNISYRARSYNGDILSAFLPFLLLLISWKLAAMLKDSSNKQTPKQYKKKSTDADTVSFHDIVCPAKYELMEIVECLNGNMRYKSVGARLPHGILLVGAAGTGKTLLARAVAGEANIPFFICNASEFIEIYVGRGASRIRDLFETARRNAPSVVFIDELDAIGSRSKRSRLNDGNSEYIQTINQLLAEMDGFSGHSCDVVVIAATNRYTSIDPTLLRSGRFDRHIRLSLPTQSERSEIISLNMRKKGLKFAEGTTELLSKLAERTVGFSGADLENLLNESIFCALRNNEEEITMVHLESVMGKMSANIDMAKQFVDEDSSNGRLSLKNFSDILYSQQTLI